MKGARGTGRRGPPGRGRGPDDGAPAATAARGRRPDPTSSALCAVALLLAVACGGGDADDGPALSDTAADGTPAAGQARTEGGSADGPGKDGARLTPIDVAGHAVRVEIADDGEERKQGLMHRDSLPPDQGMLFVYPEQQTLSFWMRETEIPLDIAFVDRRGYIVDIQQMDPHTEELHESRRPAMYALEMNRGWFEAHGVEEGDRVRF